MELLINYSLYRLDLEPFLMEVVGAKKDGRGSCIAPAPSQRMAYQSGLNSDLTKTTWVSLGLKHLLTADSKTQEPTPTPGLIPIENTLRKTSARRSKGAARLEVGRESRGSAVQPQDLPAGAWTLRSGPSRTGTAEARPPSTGTSWRAS